MKNTSLLTILFYSIYLPLFSQTTFLNVYKSEQHNQVYCAIESDEGDYIMCGDYKLSSGIKYNSYLLRVSNNGTLIAEIIDSSDNESLIGTILNSSNDPSKIFLIKSIHSSPRNKLQILEADNDLNQNLLFEFIFPDTLLYTDQFVYKYNDSIFFILLDKSTLNQSKSDFSLLKVDISSGLSTFYCPENFSFRMPSGMFYNTL